MIIWICKTNQQDKPANYLEFSEHLQLKFNLY